MNSIKSSEIIDEILSNLREGAEEIYEKIVIPEVYWIYLNQKDYAEINHKSEQIVEEAKKALTDEVVRLNKAIELFEQGIIGKSQAKLLELYNHLSGILRGKPTNRRKIKRYYSQPQKGWQISINADAENKCLEGDIRIKSILQFPKNVALQGNKTKRLITMRVDGKRVVTEEVLNEKDLSPNETHTQISLKTKISNSTENKPFALLHLINSSGKTTYKMTKNSFTVGRGGTTYWVDLPIMNNSKVSQEHLRISRDQNNGKFFVKDLSRNGTKINGQKLPSSIETVNGITRETEIKTELPNKAKIILADEITLEFEITA